MISLSNTQNLNKVLSKKRAFTIEITSPVPLDYWNDGRTPSTDMLEQMSPYLTDGFFLLTESNYFYSFELKCNPEEPNMIKEQYVIDNRNIWFLSYTTDGKITQDFILENPKIYYTGDSEYGNPLYKFEYDLLDRKIGKKFHWVRRN